MANIIKIRRGLKSNLPNSSSTTSGELRYATDTNELFIDNGITNKLINKVDDVKVDGTSVVTDRVANIDLTGKQDNLIAGDGIKIEDNVISGKDATYLQKGISRLATEEEIILGTSESVVVNALQLNKAIDKEAKARLIADESIALTKLQDYLYMYESIASDMSYEEAIKYFEENFHNRENVLTSFIPYGACSSIRSGNFYGRNYDWYYNTNTTFVVYDKAQKDKYEFLGVAQSVLDEIDFDSETTIQKLRLIPYLILDGINEHSVFCNTNVVPTGDLGITTGTHHDLEGDYICQIMLPKYVLDHFTNATDAVNWIRDEAKIFAPRNATTQLELHFMVGDPNHTYVVEFVHNEAVISEVTNSKQEVMTNFYRYDALFDENGHIDFNSVTNYGAGLERYNLLVDAHNSVDSVESMRNCIDLAQYTRAYTDIYTDPVAKIVNPNTWKTEWAHDYSDSTILPHPMDLHANSPLSDYEYSGIFEVLYNMYQTRSRETGATWQTVHSSVYDIERRELYLKVQEGNKQYHFVYPTTPRILQNIDEEVVRAITTEQEIKESIVWEAGEGEGSVITKINAKEDVGGSAKGAFAVSEGWGTVASGESSHTEGRMTMVIHAADCAHAEGNGTTAGGRASHTEGVGTVTSNIAEHAEGHYNKTNQATTVFGNAGNTLSSIGIGSGNLEIDQGRKNAFEVMQNGDAYLIGVGNYDGKNVSEANTLQEVISDKQDNLTAGDHITIDENNIISATSVWEEGTGEYSVQTVGTGCVAEGDYSVAEGESTHATGEGSHAEGAGTIASGLQSHAEGASSTATGDRAHAEGIECYASGVGSHAEGDHTLVSQRAEVAHAEGDHTVADNIAEHAQGRFNRSNHNDESTGFGDAGNTLHSIGIGTGSNIALRKNAVEVMQNGDAYLIGVGEYDGTNFSEADTVQDVISNINDNIDDLSENKQDKLIASTNIQIGTDGKTISATDTTYSAGNGLTLTGTEFSANVIDNVTSTSSTNALSANMGKELQDQIDNLKARGRYLSQWNATTGQPATQPTQLPYPYKTGDYYLVGTVGEVNYKPTGTSYTGAASTEIEIAELAIDDTYFFDGTIWHLQQNTQKIVTFASLAGQPTDNTNLAAALNDKVTKNNTITGATHTKITYDSKGLVTAGADLAESDIPALHLSKITDITATATELNYVDGVTSAIQTQLNSKAADNAVVHTTGNESISGTKTFNDTLELKNNLSFRTYGTNNSGRLQFRAQPSDNVIRGTIAITDGYSTSGSGYNGFVAQMVARSGSTSSDPFNTVRVSNKGIEYIKEANDGTITGQYVVVDDSGLVPSDRLATSGSTGQVLTKTVSGQSWQTFDALPSQTSQSGKFLTTNGTSASWANIPTEIPSQSGQSGKFLTTDGTNASWATVDALPSQSGNSGKYLKTNGSSASWSALTWTYDSTTETLTIV